MVTATASAALSHLAAVSASGTFSKKMSAPVMTIPMKYPMPRTQATAETRSKVGRGNRL